MDKKKENLNNEEELKRPEWREIFRGIFLVIIVIISICGLLRPIF